MISKFEVDLYLIMIYPSVYIEWNWCISSKAIDRIPIFSTHKTKSKKELNLSQNYADNLQIWTWPVCYMMLYISVNFE